MASQGSILPAVTRSLRLLQPAARLRSRVVSGFGRGSKVLGFPTANLQVRWEAADQPQDCEPHELDVLRFAQDCDPGIYCAWAQVADGPDRGIYKAAMSVGWNPTFEDVKVKTIEPWILHDFAEDFYGCELRLVVAGFIRAELRFEGLDELISAIRQDGEFCSEALDEPALARFLEDDLFVREQSTKEAPLKPGVVSAPCSRL
mmetsp:Transcript_123393/g.200634  ORF Transcript_123393/g.200634 Transcript_123393/m.200634 type:complete len:203 (-) Transcript_123393:35-643(-)